jgi:hypothetical protein
MTTARGTAVGGGIEGASSSMAAKAAKVLFLEYLLSPTGVLMEERWADMIIVCVFCLMNSKRVSTVAQQSIQGTHLFPRPERVMLPSLQPSKLVTR